MADQRIQAGDFLIGANHPLGYADTLNRLTLVEHDTDGTHLTPTVTGVKFRNSASADSTTLDWYEEGSFTVTFTFDTPGDLSVVYSTQTGTFTRIGRQVFVSYNLTCTPTFTTSSGNLRIKGLPYTAVQNGTGPVVFQGVTAAGYTNFCSRVAGTQKEK